MSYKCEVSNNPFSTFPTWSFLIFSLILILGALIPFITGASFGIIVNWVLDFSQSIFYSNRQRIYPQEVFYRVWTFQLSFTPVFYEPIQFLRMNQDLIIFFICAAFNSIGFIANSSFLVTLFEIDETLNNRNSTGWKWEETLCFSYISCCFSYHLYSWDPTISLQ